MRMRHEYGPSRLHVATREPRRRRRTTGMFEEAQLYAPVTRGTATGSRSTSPTTTPARTTPSTARRRNEIAAAALAWRPGEPSRASTTPTSRARDLAHGLPRARARSTSASRAAPSATRRPRSRCPSDRVPQLDEVTAGLQPLTGFSFHPAAGLVPLDEFYGSLADRVFHSTQYLRHPSAPALHARAGHRPRGDRPREPARRPADRRGQAARRRGRAALRDAGGRCSTSPTSSGSRSSSASCGRRASCAATARGCCPRSARSRSSAAAEIRPLDFHAMATLEYDITHYQPILFAVRRHGRADEPVGGFFAGFDDDMPARLTRAGAGAPV